VALVLDCTPNPIPAAQVTTCTLKASGSDGTLPRGNVNVASDGPGSFGPVTCSPSDSSTQTCSFTFTPASSASLTRTLTATFTPNDAVHLTNIVNVSLDIPWFPAGFTLWTGAGSGSGVVAYAPSSCSTLGGGSIPNGGQDSSGRICFAYLMVSRKDCLNDIYASANALVNNVVVGYTNDLEHVAAGQQVLMTSVVYGHPGATLQLTKIDCY
jgi:hypothetical protein